MRRLLWLSALVLGLLALVVALRWHHGWLMEQANRDVEADRFRNPSLARYAEWNARMSANRSLVQWVVWGGILPADAALLWLSAGACWRERRWPAFAALAVALAVAALLALAAFALAMAGPAMIG
jgi:hypothetical protein